MKKTLIAVLVVVVALAAVATGIVYAQGTQPGFGPGMMAGRRGGHGLMHDYVEQALAEKVGQTEAQVEEQFAAGKSLYQIVLDSGVAEADVPAVLSEVHKTAFAKAVEDGVLTQAQADLMLENMSANGFDQANCPMGGAGFRGGRGSGRMMGGWNRP